MGCWYDEWRLSTYLDGPLNSRGTLRMAFLLALASAKLSPSRSRSSAFGMSILHPKLTNRFLALRSSRGEEAKGESVVS